MNPNAERLLESAERLRQTPHDPEAASGATFIIFLGRLVSELAQAPDDRPVCFATMLEGPVLEKRDQLLVAAFDEHFGVDVMSVAKFSDKDRDGLCELSVPADVLKELLRNSRNSKEPLQPLSDFEDRAG